MMTNYKIFIRTIYTLCGSQGFYSRLVSNFESMSEESKLKLEETLNALPQWESDVDCILWLEA